MVKNQCDFYTKFKVDLSADGLIDEVANLCDSIMERHINTLSYEVKPTGVELYSTGNDNLEIAAAIIKSLMERFPKACSGFAFSWADTGPREYAGGSWACSWVNGALKEKWFFPVHEAHQWLDESRHRNDGARFFRFELENDNNESLEAVAMDGPCGFSIRVDGYGNCSMKNGHGDILFLEYYEDRLQMYAWSDINQEDPTFKIDFTGAKESLREKN
jgi:hypothetical protein